MTKRFFIILSILFLATSCYKYDKPKKPQNLISKDKMVEVILDIRLISSANGRNKSILEKQNLTEKRFIYKKHNIDSIQFAESNAYYSYFVEDYNEIYGKVKDSLEDLKEYYDEMYKEEQKEKNEKVLKNGRPKIGLDSVRAARDSIREKPQQDKGLITPESD